LDVGFSVDAYMIAGCLCIFCLNLDDVIIPKEPISWFKVLLDSRM